MNRKITKLELAPQVQTQQRTAAYARVSCGKDEMLHSFAAQVSFYSDLIQSKKQWEYAGVYADAAETGTKDNRSVRRKEAGREGKILEAFIRDIQSRELAITEFDEKLWLAAVDQAMVSRDGLMRFEFKNGAEVET